MTACLYRDHLLSVDRHERRIVATFKHPHRILSTSIIGGGMRDDCSHVMNHQSCEPRAHTAAMARWRDHGAEGIHRLTCQDAGLDPATTAVCSTAANMSCAGVAVESLYELSVCCIATAGVEGNATRAGDEAAWHETKNGCDKVGGTIVHLVFINQPCNEGCLVKAAAMLTEAKSCAVLDLRAASLQGSGLATGTGTDQMVICAPLAQGEEWERRFAGSHSTLGMILCRAVHQATSQALELQNGLVPSMRRGIDVALKRHGFDYAKVITLAEAHAGADFADFIGQNRMPLLMDPRAGGTAHALAEVCDLSTAGIIKPVTRDELILDQAALLACAVANDRQRFADYRHRLQALECAEPMDLVHHACCWGFHEKWPEFALADI